MLHSTLVLHELRVSPREVTAALCIILNEGVLTYFFASQKVTNFCNAANLQFYGAGDLCRRRGDSEAGR